MIETTTNIIRASPGADNGNLVLNIKHLYKSFGSNKVLSDFTLSVSKGDSIVVLGKSGSGKSVLIKCIIGLMTPDKGEIELLGTEITSVNEAELDKVRAKTGFLFQSNALYDSMTVRENLEFPLRRHWITISKEAVDHAVEKALENVGLLHTIDMMPGELSGGMRKRVALARTLILEPEIILYDEPTTGLDPVTGKEIINLMMKIQETYNTTSLIISHDMNCVKMAGKRIVILIDGCCYASGNFEELKMNPDPRVKQFFE